MPSIASSTYDQDAQPQVDGRFGVRETHTDTEGRQYDYSYLCPVGVSPQVVLEERAVVLNAQLAEREAARLIVAGTMLPLTKLKFRELFTPTERMGIDALHAGFESHPSLTTEQKAVIRTGLEDYRMAEQIDRPFDARVQQMLGLYVSMGLLTAERAAAIVAAGNG